jgi:hypothetical protein
VGYVKFTWTTKAVTARVLVTNIEGAGVSGIYDRSGLIDAAAIDAEKGGIRPFKNEPLDVSLIFGPATGTRSAFGDGRVRTVYRKVGSESRGNSDILQLDSLIAVGAADITPTGLVTSVPALDQDGDHLISFNGTLTDLAPSSLTNVVFPVGLHVFVDGTEMLSDVDAPENVIPDFSLAVTDPDASGKSIFTITNLVLPEGQTPHSLVIQAVDVSGNVRKMETKIADSGLNY